MSHCSTLSKPPAMLAKAGDVRSDRRAAVAPCVAGNFQSSWEWS